MKNCPIALKNCQSMLKIMSNTKKPLKSCPKIFNFCQIGGILPNLETLVLSFDVIICHLSIQSASKIIFRTRRTNTKKN